MTLKASIKGNLRFLTAYLGRLIPHPDPLTPRILCYHQVEPEPSDEWSVTPDQLREQMRLLNEIRNPVSLSQIVDWIVDGTKLPEGAVAITFDDGFVGVLEYAAPIFSELSIPATVFVAPDLVEKGTSAADPSYRAQGPFMNWQQLGLLQKMGWTIGSHAMNHPQLSQLTESESLQQIQQSRTLINKNLGMDCNLLAYPYGTPGTVSEREHNFVAETGYEAAFMAITGVPKRGMNKYVIPRSKILGTDNNIVFRAILDGTLDIWKVIESTH